MVIEDGADPLHGPALHKRLVRRPELQFLERPHPNGRVTVADALLAHSPAEHGDAVRAWASDVWDAWAVHHQTVRGWLEEALGE